MALVKLMDRAEQGAEPKAEEPKKKKSEKDRRQEGGEGRLIFTVGHGARSAAELVSLLKEAHVRTLVDVRAFPVSRRHPQFSPRTAQRHARRGRYRL